MPSLWQENKAMSMARVKYIDAMSMARKDAMSMARKDAMSMAYECLCFEQGVESLLSCVPFSHLHASEVPMEWMSCWFLLG